MAERKSSKKQSPTLEKQLTKIGLAVIEIRDTLKILPTLATKQELVEVKQRLFHVEEKLTGVEGSLTGVDARLTGVDARLANVEEGLTRIEETKADKTDIHQLNDHLTGLLTRYIDFHDKTHKKIDERVTKLETTVSSN